MEYLLPLFGERMFEVDEDGWTFLHYAVAGGSLPVMRYLVDKCGFDSLKTTVSYGVVHDVIQLILHSISTHKHTHISPGTLICTHACTHTNMYAYHTWYTTTIHPCCTGSILL